MWCAYFETKYAPQSDCSVAEPANFFLEGTDCKYFRLCGTEMSQLLNSAVIVQKWPQTKEHGCVPVNLYLQDQAGSQFGLQAAVFEPLLSGMLAFI